jgi:hypothetical protein
MPRAKRQSRTNCRGKNVSCERALRKILREKEWEEKGNICEEWAKKKPMLDVDSAVGDQIKRTQEGAQTGQIGGKSGQKCAKNARFGCLTRA